jgi:hypothetical protein
VALLIAASIVVARHMKDTEELYEFRQTPGTVALIASAIRWARQSHRSDRSRHCRRLGTSLPS